MITNLKINNSSHINKGICTPLFICIILISACIKKEEIPIDLSFEKQMSITCVLQAKKDIELTITGNNLPNEIPKEIYIEDAIVELFEEETYIGHFMHDSAGLYQLGYKPKPGYNYTLKATCPGYPDIIAETTVPTQCPFELKHENIENVQLIYLTTPKIDTLSYFAITIACIIDLNLSPVFPENKIWINQGKFMDAKFNRSVEFYNDNQAKIIKEGDLARGIDIFTQNKNYKHYYKTHFPNNRERSFGNYYTVFYSNRDFVGNKNTMQIVVNMSNNLFIVHRLSPELYLALRSIAAHEATTRVGIFDGLSNPIAVSGNVKGGYGYFGAVASWDTTYKSYW